MGKRSGCHAGIGNSEISIGSTQQSTRVRESFLDLKTKPNVSICKPSNQSVLELQITQFKAFDISGNLSVNSRALASSWATIR